MESSDSKGPGHEGADDAGARSRRATRIVNVFISSTFQDFQKERDELVKKTFPALRNYCTKKHILFIDVDLRWGITKQQADTGEILPLCLAEIRNCRPFFLGLLGQRYGWVPDHIAPKFLQEHAWLREHREKSITELEILYGALGNDNLEGKRFFYFRSPEYHLQLPAASRNGTAQPPREF